MIEDLLFEQLKEEDLHEVFCLCTDCFGEAVPFDNVYETYNICKNDKSYHFIVGKYKGKIIAYATMVLYYNLLDGTYPIASLWYVCVHKDYRRQGVACELFKEIDRIADENRVEIINFTCLKDNNVAKSFYRSLGYSEDLEVAFIKNIYEQWD